MIFNNGVDEGYLKETGMWWFIPGEHQYRIARLDEDYPEQYFQQDHVNAEHVQAYCDAVQSTFLEMTGQKIETIVEFGPAGGWFMQEFLRRGVNIEAVEGAVAGMKRCTERGIPPELVYHHDIRKPLPHPMYGHPDMVLASEILEHLEIPFHAAAVHNLIKTSDLVLFSSEEPGTNRNHLHHPGEQPLHYWQKLFDFYNYGCHMIEDEVYDATARRARCVFYNRETYPLNQIS